MNIGPPPARHPGPFLLTLDRAETGIPARGYSPTTRRPLTYNVWEPRGNLTLTPATNNFHNPLIVMVAGGGFEPPTKGL